MKIRVRGGIDPGKQGMIFIFIEEKYYFYPIPLIGKEYDNLELNNIFKSLKEKYNDIHFVLENVSPDPTWGCTQLWSLGGCIQMFKQALVCNEIPYTMISPRTWQKEMWEGIMKQYKPATAVQVREKKNGSVDTKKTSEVAVKRLFPNLNCYITSIGNKSINYNDNLGDSALIACYCKRKF